MPPAKKLGISLRTSSPLPRANRADPAARCGIIVRGEARVIGPRADGGIDLAVEPDHRGAAERERERLRAAGSGLTLRARIG